LSTAGPKGRADFPVNSEFLTLAYILPNDHVRIG
jgi:hypothetical protein